MSLRRGVSAIGAAHKICCPKMGTGDSASGQLPSKLFRADPTKLRTCNRLTQRSDWHAIWLTDLNRNRSALGAHASSVPRFAAGVG